HIVTCQVHLIYCSFFFFFQAEDGIRDRNVTGVQTCVFRSHSQRRLLCRLHPRGASLPVEASMRTSRVIARTFALPALVTIAPLATHAGAQGTLADYRRAATATRRMTGLTVDIAEAPTWAGPTRFWYRKS